MENLDKTFRIFLVRELSLKLPCLFHGQSRIQIRKETERNALSAFASIPVFSTVYIVHCNVHTWV